MGYNKSKNQHAKPRGENADGKSRGTEKRPGRLPAGGLQAGGQAGRRAGGGAFHHPRGRRARHLYPGAERHAPDAGGGGHAHSARWPIPGFYHKTVRRNAGICLPDGDPHRPAAGYDPLGRHLQRLLPAAEHDAGHPRSARLDGQLPSHPPRRGTAFGAHASQ